MNPAFMKTRNSYIHKPLCYAQAWVCEQEKADQMIEYVRGKNYWAEPSPINPSKHFVKAINFIIYIWS